MKLAKAAAVWAFATSTALILPASADATPYPAPSVKEVTAFVQGKVNAKVPSDKQPGERTDCDYVPSKAKQGYKITCYTFDKAGHQIAMTTMHFLEPEGDEATFVYVVYPSTPAAASTVTFIVTATGGDNASLTYGSGLQTIQKNDVRFRSARRFAIKVSRSWKLRRTPAPTMRRSRVRSRRRDNRS